MSRILGLDLGDRRIGAAVSDPGGKIAFPLATIEVSSEEKMIKELKEIVEEYDVKEMLIGLPYGMRGNETLQTAKAREQIEVIRNALRLPVKTWDERLTTKEANRSLEISNVKKKKGRKLKDQIAAALILQGYLDAENVHAGRKEEKSRETD